MCVFVYHAKQGQTMLCKGGRMNITQAKFVVSVADAANIPDYGAPEIAIAGKSNVGKSSFINYIVGQKKLAKTSSEPGRTRLLNYFQLNAGQLYFVDLPGYGYAKVNRTEKQKWGNMIEGYLQNSPNLINVFVLLDIRRIPSEDDAMLLNYLYHYGIPFTVIVTKADKLSRQQRNKCLTDIASVIGVGAGDIIVTSSLAGTGKDRVLSRIAQLLENAKETDNV